MFCKSSDFELFEFYRLNEQRMQHIQAASSAGGEDAEKLNVYRQQAALIARKKDAAVEQLRYVYG